MTSDVKGHAAASVLWLLTIAACADDAPPPPPPAVVSPQPAVVAPQAHVRPAPRRGYAEEVDELLRSLKEGDTESRSSPAAAPRPAPGPATYRNPGNPDQTREPDPYATERASYQENLETCLDGRFSAFCDHGVLTDIDAARVRDAEYQANQVTCIDPEWQHLCRPELLPPGETPPPVPAAP